MKYSDEQIMSMAPDPASAKAGRSLATTNKWQNLGQNDRAIWGECQGSGARPYQTVIDLSEPAFKCSCPSRKFPCKHSLGLFLLLASHPVSSTTPIPPWASEWLTKRDDQSQRRNEAAKKVDELPDEETIARRAAQKIKRAADRELKVISGLKELDLWLRDLVRHGMASAATRSFDFWEQMAARLIDAQAPGLARRVREMSGVPHSGDAWIELLLNQISSLFLLIRAFERIEALPGPTQADVRAAIGWNLKEEELSNETVISDEWLVMGQRTSGEEAFRVRRTWLWGQRSGQGALVLEFAAAGQYFATDLLPGTTAEAELLFYPGNYPQRAVVRRSINTTQWSKEFPGYSLSEKLIMSYTNMLALNPWLQAVPAPLQKVYPVNRNNRWFVRDLDERMLRLRTDPLTGWKLTALSGGEPIAIFGEWNGRTLLPISAWVDARFIELVN